MSEVPPSKPEEITVAPEELQKQESGILPKELFPESKQAGEHIRAVKMNFAPMVDAFADIVEKENQDDALLESRIQEAAKSVVRITNPREAYETGEGLTADLRHFEVSKTLVDVVKRNAGHVVTGEVKFPEQEELKEFFQDASKFYPEVMAAPYEKNHVFGLNVAPIGPYGQPLSEALVVTSTLLMDQVENLSKHSEQFAAMAPEVIKKLARSEMGNKAPMGAFKEGIATFSFICSLLTDEKLENFEDPLRVLQEAQKLGFFKEIGKSFPATVIGPMGLTGSYLPGFLQSKSGELQLNDEILEKMRKIQRDFRKLPRSKVSLPSAGYGCPLAYPDADGRTGIDRLGKVFIDTLKKVTDTLRPKWEEYEREEALKKKLQTEKELEEKMDMLIKKLTQAYSNYIISVKLFIKNPDMLKSKEENEHGLQSTGSQRDFEDLLEKLETTLPIYEKYQQELEVDPHKTLEEYRQDMQKVLSATKEIDWLSTRVGVLESLNRITNLKDLFNFLRKLHGGKEAVAIIKSHIADAKTGGQEKVFEETTNNPCSLIGNIPVGNKLIDLVNELYSQNRSSPINAPE